MTNELSLRLAIFLSVFSCMAIWEAAAPFRKPLQSRRYRWPTNVGITLINSILVKLIFPMSAVAIAAHFESNSQGLFNYIKINSIIAVIVSVIILDLIIYIQHVAFHFIPALWRLHRMHHTDVDFDVTTGARFHPVEILLSMLIKVGSIALFGIPAEAVLIFEILLNATAMFNHSNISLPKFIDTPLRAFLVTPDMHRIHHSVIVEETNSNFGFNLTWWDQIFRTYKHIPQNNPQFMEIGLSVFRDKMDNRLDQMLIQPFKK